MTRAKNYFDETTTIQSLLSEDIVSVSKDHTVFQAAHRLHKNKIGAILVTQGKKLLGIVSERDIVSKVIAKNKDPRHISVGSIMTTKLYTATLTDSFSDVLEEMQKRHVRHIPVIDKNGSAIGIVSIRDLMAMAQARVEKMMDKNLMLDALTGLKNYRFFNSYLGVEITRNLYSGSTFSLLFIDMDHFKKLNDTLGHASGNTLLKKFGEILTRKSRTEKSLFSLRKSDIAIRFGGDEFCVILPDTPPEGARIVAERLLQLTEIELNTIRGIKPPVPITLSIGISTFPKDAKDPKTLLHLADLALYEAKAKGRNRICTYHPSLSKLKK